MNQEAAPGSHLRRPQSPRLDHPLRCPGISDSTSALLSMAALCGWVARQADRQTDIKTNGPSWLQCPESHCPLPQAPGVTYLPLPCPPGLRDHLCPLPSSPDPRGHLHPTALSPRPQGSPMSTAHLPRPQGSPMSTALLPSPHEESPVCREPAALPTQLPKAGSSALAPAML